MAQTGHEYLIEILIDKTHGENMLIIDSCMMIVL
jgi:hypothetical protein